MRARIGPWALEGGEDDPIEVHPIPVSQSHGSEIPRNDSAIQEKGINLDNEAREAIAPCFSRV
jgi:hypothetical protein